MARPRVFLSSTFYDLKAIRADIELALSQLSFDSVLHERGRIPYEKDKKLEQSCYREISNCDIVVSMIGGRLGSASTVDEQFSVSEMELRTAVTLDKQLFVFVDRNVQIEFGTWAKNPGVKLPGFRGWFEIGKSCSGFPLKDRRRSVAECRVPAVKVVPSFNEVEDREFRFLMRAKPVSVEQLALKGRVEALAHRVIVAVADRSHRGANVGFSAA